MPDDARARGDQLPLEFRDGLVDLLLDLGPDAGGAEEEPVERPLDGVVGVEKRAQCPSSLELQQCLPRPPQQEQEEDEVPESAEGITCQRQKGAGGF